MRDADLILKIHSLLKNQPDPVAPEPPSPPRPISERESEATKCKYSFSTLLKQRKLLVMTGLQLYARGFVGLTEKQLESKYNTHIDLCKVPDVDYEYSRARQATKNLWNVFHTEVKAVLLPTLRFCNCPDCRRVIPYKEFSELRWTAEINSVLRKLQPRDWPHYYNGCRKVLFRRSGKIYDRKERLQPICDWLGITLPDRRTAEYCKNTRYWYGINQASWKSIRTRVENTIREDALKIWYSISAEQRDLMCKQRDVVNDDDVWRLWGEESADHQVREIMVNFPDISETAKMQQGFPVTLRSKGKTKIFTFGLRLSQRRKIMDEQRNFIIDGEIDLQTLQRTELIRMPLKDYLVQGKTYQAPKSWLQNRHETALEVGREVFEKESKSYGDELEIKDDLFEF